MNHASQTMKPQSVFDNGTAIAVLTGDAETQHLNKRRIEVALQALRGIDLGLLEETMAGQEDQDIIAVCVADHHKHVALVRTLQERIAQQELQIHQMRSTAVMAQAVLIEREQVNSEPAAEAFASLMGKFNSQPASLPVAVKDKATLLAGVAVLLNCLGCFKRRRA